MPITPAGAADQRPLRLVANRITPTGAGFAVALATADRPAAPAAPAPRAASATGWLLQRVDTGSAARRQTLRRAERLLGRLHALRIDLLDHSEPGEAAWSALREEAAGLRAEGVDEAGAELLEAIELRVAVELAKLERES